MDTDTARDEDLDEALARARAAFAGKSDEQILKEVAEVVQRVRETKRKETASQKSA